MLRSFNFLVLLAVLCGTVLVWRAGMDRERLLEQQRQLAKEVGIVSFEDQDKIHVFRIDTGDPLHFAWQIFLPANHSYCWGDNMANCGRTKNSQVFVARLRYRKIDDTWYEWFLKSDGASYLRELSGDERPDEWVFEAGPVAERKLYDPATSVVTLIKTPPGKRSESSSRWEAAWCFGTNEAMTAQQEKINAIK